MAEVLDLLLPSDAGQEGQKDAFRLTFRLLAAKILIDREHPAAADWAHDDASAVLSGIQGYYSLGLLGSDVAEVSADNIVAAWARLRTSITLRNISSDSLAFVYENTLVTADTRKLFGTHSTPCPLAEYVLSQLDLSCCNPETVRIAEPFAGDDLSYVLPLLVGFDLVEVHHGGRLSAMGGVSPLVSVEGDPPANAGLGLRAGLPGVQIDALMFQGPPKEFDEDVVEAALFPVHRAPGADPFSRSVQAKDVNCEPWSLLNTSGLPW